VLFHLSRAGVDVGGTHFAWDELRPWHVILSEAWEGDLMAALAASRGSGIDGGKGKDKVNVKHRVVIDVPPVSWHVPDTGFVVSFAL
jgi:hypothetical protein